MLPNTNLKTKNIFFFNNIMGDWLNNLTNSISNGTTSLWNKTKEMGQSVKNRFSSSQSTQSVGGKTRKMKYSKKMRKMKGGNTPVPYCPQVWSNTSPFPQAVGGKAMGRRKMRKLKGGNSSCSTTAPVPYYPQVWSVGSPVSQNAGRKKYNKKTKKTKKY